MCIVAFAVIFCSLLPSHTVLSLSYNPTPITSDSSFVTTEGITFQLDSEPFYFAGTNAWYLGNTDILTDDEVMYFFQAAGEFGFKVVRYFAFSNGPGTGVKTPNPIQPVLGVWNEDALRRVDLILQQAALNGIRLILPLANFEPFLGGWQWWVDQVMGPGFALELFLVDDLVKCAWKQYVSMLLTRNNTLTGIVYRDDPTIFALELSNEPHTQDLFERHRAMTPGRMVLGFLGEMSAFLRSIDSKHMITTGEEGYRADGPTDCCEGNEWLNGGYKGVDFVRNSALDNISFSTIHVYPDNWGIPADNFEWIISNFILDRAAIAHNHSKPLIMEEFGMKKGYLSTRDILLQDLGFAAFDAGFGGMMVWMLWFVGLDYESPNDYNFRLGEQGTNATEALVAWSWQ